ncbi:transposase, partial [Bacillus pumilus]|uniref:transposase n=1 Tax=Bacillus pumilus TaxID=1408 RepID=UPI003703A18C
MHFSFILHEVKPYYTQNKRPPSLHPLIFFKIIFIPYLYPIPSQTQLQKQIYYNIPYTSFLRFNINHPLP